MTRKLAILFACTLSTALLAGCMDAGDGGGHSGPGATDEGHDAATGNGDAYAGGGDGAGGDADSADSIWHAYRFEQTVTTATGEAGHIRSFAYATTQESSGEVVTIDVQVDVLDVATFDVRAQRMDFESGDYEGETVSTPVKLRPLRHTLDVVRDDTGEHAAGDSATVTVYLPVEDAGASEAYAWFFTKFDYEQDGESGTYEYYVTDEMEAEAEEGSVMYLPFTEGEDATGWWAFQFMVGTYGLGAFAGYAGGDESFEEGSYSFGGYSWSTTREEVRLGAHAFDAWRVETGATDGDESATQLLVVATGLPMPVEYAFESRGSGDGSLMSYRLTDLTLS